MSVYLSRLILDPRSPVVRRDLADCHDLHARLMTGFPTVDASSGPARQQLGVLYRVETRPRTASIQVIVQSLVEPDWTRLGRGYLLDTHGAPPNPDAKSIDAALARVNDGLELTFRLRANPTRRIDCKSHPDDPLRGKRVELRTEADWNDWLARKAERGGFKLLAVHSEPDTAEQQRFASIYGTAPEVESVADIRVRQDSKVVGRRGGPARAVRQRLTFGSVVFEGRLRVTDATAFRQTLETGIGPAKAYGFGLLSIGPGG